MPKTPDDSKKLVVEKEVVTDLERTLKETKQALEETKKKVEQLDEAIKRLKETGR